MKQLLVLLIVLTAGTAIADDWPQWMGPKRDNVWREKGLLEKFPADGPKVLWRRPIAGGYAGPAVANGRVYVCDYVTEANVKVANFARKQFSGIERVLCLDEKTGEVQWKHEYPVKYSVSYPGGPRCTPTVDGNRVYTLGTEGDLKCFDTSSGDIVWSKQLREEYKTKADLWGYTNHPLIDGDKLICIAGGESCHAVAFNKKNGEEIWRSRSAKAQGYSPPTIIEAGKTRQLVLLAPDSVSAVDPETGKELWTVPYEATSGSIIMSPIKWQDYLYVGGYSNKNLLLKLRSDKPGADVVWRNQRKKGISPVNVQPFLSSNVIYGMNQGGMMVAVSLPSGERLWETNKPVKEGRGQGNSTAFIIKQAERYWLFNELGELIICRLSMSGYEELDRRKVIEPSGRASGRKVVWSAPAFANKHIYIRNDDEIICVDVSK